MEGRPPPLDPLRLPQSVPPFHLHTAAGLLSASATAHAFPYFSSLTSGGGNGLGALGGSPFRTPHSASTAAAMRQFWPPTPPPDSYSRYGGSYYSLFPSVGPLGSPPDPYSGHQALFSRLSHSASPYSPVLDLHRDPNFLSSGLNLTSPLTPTNLSNHVSPMSPLATSSLLSPPTATSAGVTPSGGTVDSLAAQGEKHHHSDGLLTTVHQPNGTSHKAGHKTPPTAAPPMKERRPEKSRSKKSSQKARDLTGSKIKETRVEPGHCVKCNWSAHSTELPPWPAPPTSVTTKVTATTAPVVTTTVSPCQNSESVGGASRTSLTFCTSLCIPSDQVSSTVPSPSAHPPSLLSPSGQPIVSSSTSDVEGSSRTPDISTTPVPDSSKPASPIITEPAESPIKKPLPTAEHFVQFEKEKPVDLSDSSVAPTDLSLSPCSSTTAEEKRTMVMSVSPIVAKVTLPTEKSDAAKIVDLSRETPKAELEVRPTCQYEGQVAPTKQEPVDFRCEPVASCAVKPQMASTYMPLSKAAVVMSVQQTKVVSSTRVRGVKAGGVAVGMTKAAATSRAVIASPLTHISPKVQEVAPVNLKVTRPLVNEPATPATLACVQRSGEGTPRLAVAPEARKIVVEEKCDTTVSVVPALSVLNAANQHIPVGIAVAQQRQDHTITCSKTSMSSSSSEQGQITAVSCSTVILTTGNSDKTACISEQKHGLQPHPGSLAEATTTCLVTAGPSTSHSPWDQHPTDALSLRPPTATLRWLAAPPVANASPSVVTPTLWLGQNAAPLDPTPSSAFPLTSPGGFQLARDAVTGQLYLVPAASWTLTSPAAPVQQILTQQHTTFQQIVPETWSTDMMKAAEVVPKLEVAETKDPTLTAFSTLGAAPQQPMMSYVYDAAPVVQPLVTTHTAAVAPIMAPPTKVSQGTSPQTSLTPSPPPQQVVVEQGVQASDTDGAVDESDDDYARGDPTHVTKVANRVTSVTTAVQVDMDSQTASEDNETNDSATCFVRTTFDCANQTDDLPLQKEVPSSCDETTCDEEDRDSHQQQAVPVASVASVVSNRSSEIHFTSDSEIDDSIPVLTTQSSGVREFIDHHGLDLLVDSIEEFAASQESEMERMPQLSKSASETGSPLISPSESPRHDGPPNLSSASPSSRPGEFSVQSSPSSPKLVLASPEYDSTDFESSPHHCAASAREDKTNKQQRTNQCAVNGEDSLKLRLPQGSTVAGVDSQKLERHSAVPLETVSCRSPQQQLPSGPTKLQRTEGSFEQSIDTSQQPLFWTTSRENWRSTKPQPTTEVTSEEVKETVAALAPSYDGSCTDGLGLLCALAEQRFLEESRKEQQRPEPPVRDEQPEPEEDLDVELECQESAEVMDPVEREMRMQLAELQRKFREKRQELANFQPRKEKECSTEEKLHTDKKMEQVRHKKRRHSIAAIKAPEAPMPEALRSESPKAEERVPSLHSMDDAFSALLRTPDQRQKPQMSTNKPVLATCEARDSEKANDEGRQQCVPVLTIKLSPEQYHDEASKSEVTEPESASDSQPVAKRRKRKGSSKEKTSAAHSPKKENVDEKVMSPSPEPPAAKKNSRAKEDRRSKSFSEGDFWCVRRSERIFLLDAGVVSSSSLSISDNPDKATTPSRSRSSGTTKSQARSRTPSSQPTTKLSAKRQQSSSPCAKNVVKQKRSCKRELVSVLKKCRHGREARQENDDDSDSDSTENVPLSRLSSRERPTGVQEQQCYLEPSDLHDLTRVVMLEDGLFYAGYINEIQAPDVYGITLDGERGNRPHIFSQEEMLKEAVREVKPRSLQELPEGRRVCAYWSQQYRCLYPGAVAKATSPDPSPDSTLVYVEFDDGDSGKIPLEDVRLLPQDFPTIDEQHARGRRVRKPFALKAGKDPHPSLVLNKKRSRTSQDSGEEPKDDECRSKKMKKHKKSKMKKTKIKNTPSSSHDSDDSDVFGGEEKTGSGAAKKRRREHKHRHHHKHHRCHHRRKHRHHRKHQDAEKDYDSESPRHNADTVKAPSTSLSCSSEQTSGCSANCSPSAAEETRDCKHPELTVRIRTSSTEMQQADSDAGGESSADASEDSSSSSSDEDDAKERRTSVATAAEQTDTRKPVKRKERLPSVEKSKIAAFLPERQLWRWSGKSFRRPGCKGKAKKEFYKAICRGKETITVGDCAVFLSTGRPNLPYIGRIETMWQSWGGNMIVRVKWFYHPDETKGLAKLIQPKGALFQSPHADENDVQTISHKCEVLSWNDYRALCKSDAADGTSDTYYLAGSYDPYTNTICIEPQVKKP